MSSTIKEKICCPSCKKEQDVALWKSINASQNPGAKEEIIEKRFFLFCCEYCKYISELSYPCLYHDMDRDIMIWLSPEEDLEEEEKIAKIQPMVNELHMGISKKYRFRLVSDNKDLVEKIKIFDEDRDDKLVEISKLLLLSYICHDKPQFGAEKVYFENEDDEEQLIFLNGKGERLACLFPNDLYDHVGKIFKKNFEDRDRQKIEIVDSHWAIRAVKEELYS